MSDHACCDRCGIPLLRGEIAAGRCGLCATYEPLPVAQAPPAGAPSGPPTGAAGDSDHAPG